VIRTDSQGNVLWDKCFQGGSSLAKSINIAVAADGGYVLNTRVNSKFRLYRLDSNGNAAWFREYGDSVAPTQLTTLNDSGFLLGGCASLALGGTNSDYWVVRTDIAGNQLWNLLLGGTRLDYLYTAVQTSDGGFFFGGVSRSGADGNKTAPALGGPTDYWGVKVSPDCVKLRATRATSETNGPTTLQLSGPADTYLIEYSDDLGTWTPFVTNALVGYSMSVTPPVSPPAKRLFRARNRP